MDNMRGCREQAWQPPTIGRFGSYEVVVIQSLQRSMETSGRRAVSMQKDSVFSGTISVIAYDLRAALQPCQWKRWLLLL